MTLHLTQFEGANALSAFRSQQLLTDLVAIHPKITGITARFVHLVASQSAPDSALQQRLQALLTYGESAAVPGQGDAVFVVTPRLGTISPWASKATDIARNCGLDVFRVERITEYAIAIKGGLLGGGGLFDLRRGGVVALGRVRQGLARGLVRAGQIEHLSAQHLDDAAGVGFRVGQRGRLVGFALPAEQEESDGRDDDQDEHELHVAQLTDDPNE